jgi:hypothetical protein
MFKCKLSAIFKRNFFIKKADFCMKVIKLESHRNNKIWAQLLPK